MCKGEIVLFAVKMTNMHPSEQRFVVNMLDV